MSMWKRGSNLVKGIIAEASKSVDPERVRVLEEELEAHEKKSPMTHPVFKEKKEKEAVIASQNSPTDNQKIEAKPVEAQPLTPKKRTI